MSLEQELYQPIFSQERQQPYFVVGDLEYLSSSVLYGFIIKPLGFGNDRSEPLKIGRSEPLKKGNRGVLTIRDFPSSGFQLHIHEAPGGKPLLKDYSGKKIVELNSYDAAMADLNADLLDIKKIFKI